MGVWGTDRQDCSSQHLLADPYSRQVPFLRGVCLGLVCSRDFFFFFFDLFFGGFLNLYGSVAIGRVCQFWDFLFAGARETKGGGGAVGGVGGGAGGGVGGVGGVAGGGVGGGVVVVESLGDGSTEL